MPIKKKTEQQATIENHNYQCFKCNDIINDHDGFIKCQTCNQSAHHNCLNISKHIASFLKANSSFLYMCSSCTPKLNILSSLSDEINILKEAINTQQSFIESIEPRLLKTQQAFIESIDPRLSSMEKNIKALINPNPPNKIPLTTSPPSVYTPPGPPQAQPLPILQNPTKSTTDISMMVRDAMEREQKRQNAILFGLEESHESDLTKIRNIIHLHHSHAQTIAPEDILEVTRNGPEHRYNDGSIAPRFCKVVCKNEQIKQLFIKTINHIARNNKSFNKLRSRPDLSLLQRIRSRELRAELKRRYELGETNLYIDYHMECIKPKTHNPPYIFWSNIQHQPSLTSKPSTSQQQTDTYQTTTPEQQMDIPTSSNKE